MAEVIKSGAYTPDDIKVYLKRKNILQEMKLKIFKKVFQKSENQPLITKMEIYLDAYRVSKMN